MHLHVYQRTQQISHTISFVFLTYFQEIQEDTSVDITDLKHHQYQNPPPTDTLQLILQLTLLKVLMLPLCFLLKGTIHGWKQAKKLLLLFILHIKEKNI